MIDNKPMTLADVAEQLVTVNEAIAEQNKTLSALKTEKDQIEEHLRELMTTAGISSFKSGNSHIRLNRSEVPNVVDWEAYYAYIRDNEAFYLLERRPATTAWREECQLLAGVVPGTEPFTRVSISLTKAG